MQEILDKKKIRKVFRDVQKHLAIAQLIRCFSTNKEDIREKSLSHVDLSRSRRVLELGCAFGAFTEALRGKLHPAAKIIGIDMISEYKPFFLQACDRAGYAGQFFSSGIEKIKKFSDHAFDAIICSYALYFFPEMIPEIARILQAHGYFITITHSQNDMREMVSLIRKTIAHENTSGETPLLPIEIIFEQFSAENGARLLEPFFGEIKEIAFNNSLVFQPQDIHHCMDYFQFKKSFFLTGHDLYNPSLIHRLTDELQTMAIKNHFITLCKDDKIFICSQPRRKDSNP
jgi:ubiquinone/menaquinone biosynthesis C-methylase UbiE